MDQYVKTDVNWRFVNTEGPIRACTLTLQSALFVYFWLVLTLGLHNDF